MTTETNPTPGVEAGSLAEAQARLLGPLVTEEAPEQEEPEQESPEEETLEADEHIEDDPVEEDSDDPEVGDQSHPEAQTEEDEAPYHTIKYNGEEYEVTLEELKSGYQMQKDYTQGKQGIADERKEIETLRGSLEEERARYLEINQQILNQQHSALKSFDDVDWTGLKESDPLAFIEKMAEKQDVERQIQQGHADYEAAMTEQQAISNERLQTYLQEQAEVLAQAVPEYADPENGTAFRKGMSDYAVANGYTVEEIAAVSNARDLVILNKARMYDDLQTRKTGIRNKKAAAKPGIRVKASSPQGKESKARQAMADKKAAFQRSGGKQKDAQGLILDMLRNK
tara:strand:- start:32387 stop:33409 length:1023 start_codon:yes stop_codon:yes gene_type:complete